VSYAFNVHRLGVSSVSITMPRLRSPLSGIATTPRIIRPAGSAGRGYGVSCFNCFADRIGIRRYRIAPTAAGTEARPLKHLKHETPIFRDRRNRRIRGGRTRVRAHTGLALGLALTQCSQDAYAEFERTVVEEGMRAFLDKENVIPFRR
jgi:hypothetical protein